MIYLPPSWKGSQFLVDGSGITAAPRTVLRPTNSQGVYTLENISIGTHIITFTKADYQTVSVTRCGRKIQ